MTEVESTIFPKTSILDSITWPHLDSSRRAHMGVPVVKGVD